MDTREFQHPPKQYREVPFWSWNDDLDPAGAAPPDRHDGRGRLGRLLHARPRRPAARPTWASAGWSASTPQSTRRAGAACCAWLYDEDKWPSGFAGGLSVSQDPEFRLQYLVLQAGQPRRPAARAHSPPSRPVKSKAHLRDIRPDPIPPSTARTATASSSSTA